MELRELGQVLRRNWILALSVFSVCALVGLIGAFVPASRYMATATLLVQPTTDPNDPGRSLTNAQIEAVRFLITSLPEQVKTRGFREAVRGSLPEQFQQVRSRLSAEVEPGTAVLRLSAETDDPDASEAAANAAAEQLIERQLSQIVTITVIDRAYLPSAPSGPLREALVGGAVVFGAIAAIFASLVASAVRRRVTSVSELRDRFGLEILAEIPHSRRFPETPPELFGQRVDPPVAEAFHRLRANLEIATGGQPLEAVAVTSCIAGEGKSCVSANLAWAIASSNRPVVAIDCDLRRPALHRAFRVDLGNGVADVADGFDVVSLVRPSALPLLGLLTAGTTQRHPTDAVSLAVPRVLAALRSPERALLIDCAHVGVAETTLVVAMTRAVILVVDPKRCAPTELELALAELRHARAEVIGVVLNRCRSRKHRSSPYLSLESERKRRRWRIRR